MIDFGGRVVLVTGAAGGLGRASAQAFASQGATVVAIDLERGGNEETVAIIEKDGGKAHALVADVRDETQVEEAMSTIADRFGQLDAAHNNAGIVQRPVPMADLSIDEWRRLLEANLTSVFVCMKHEL